jgi:hypothetical protein
MRRGAPRRALAHAWPASWWRAWRVSSAGPGQDGVPPTRRRSALGGRVVGGPDLPSASGYRTPGRARRGLQRPGAPADPSRQRQDERPQGNPGQLLGALALGVAINPQCAGPGRKLGLRGLQRDLSARRRTQCRNDAECENAGSPEQDARWSSGADVSSALVETPAYQRSSGASGHVVPRPLPASFEAAAVSRSKATLRQPPPSSSSSSLGSLARFGRGACSSLVWLSSPARGCR